jgi:hypothetical protein
VAHRYRAALNDGDRLVLAARFEAYLARRGSGDPAPRSAREAAERIGRQAHTVAKRCENIRNRRTPGPEVRPGSPHGGGSAQRPTGLACSHTGPGRAHAVIG